MAEPVSAACPQAALLVLPPIRRSAEEVERLVSGASAYICDACIADCVAVLEQHGGFAGARPVN
jgi:hypothetical protein